MGIPACLVGITLLYYITTKQLQIFGFCLIAICFVVLASLFFPLKEHYGDALFAVYCCLLFSLSAGTNLTTFILPAETFPKKVRATFNGVCAACGKIGAVVGVYMFGGLADATDYPTGKSFNFIRIYLFFFVK